MNLKIPAGILDATRLVRQGQLSAATQAIQLALRGDAGAHAAYAPGEHDTVIDGDFRIVSDAPPVQAQGRFITKSCTNAAGTREYKLYIPGAQHAPALPVVVMLHGCQQGPDDFAAATRMNALAEEFGLIVVYPKQAMSANQSNCWNWFEAKHQHRGDGEPSLIAAITREVIAAYGADAQRVYVAGLSAGGAMAQVMATTYPDVYAAVGVHSGLEYAAAHDVPSAFAAMRGSRRSKRKSRDDRRAGTVPTIVFHGDNDTTVHPSNGEELIANASASGGGAQHERTVERGQASGRAYTRTTYRNADGQPVIEQWLVHGGAHAWSGGSAEGSFSDPAGPDASRAMVRFFLLHKN
jgi:poly(hydroxyalkanoate) depolymerase family esterase